MELLQDPASQVYDFEGGSEPDLDQIRDRYALGFLRTGCGMRINRCYYFAGGKSRFEKQS